MNQQEASELLKKYNNGQASMQEKILLEDWYAKEGTKQQLAADELDLLSLKDEIWEKTLDLSGLAEAQTGLRRHRQLWQRVGLLAATVATIVFGLWFYNTRRFEGSETTKNLVNYANDIKPGRNTATLTLPDGKVITLSDAKTGVVVGSDLRYNDNTAVIPGADPSSGTDPSSRTNVRDLLNNAGPRDLSNRRDDGKTVEMTIMNTPRGGTYQITLPDGSKVWLNAASSIKFPSNFDKSQTRSVELSGEAYFEVSKNKARPFVVKSNGQEVTVLGTHFNINSYADEAAIKTTLLEGSVRVSPLSYRRDEVVLKPSQQAVLYNNSIKVKQIDAAEAVAWKNGKFVFTDQDITSIMRMLSRWYNVEVIYQGDFKGKTFDGSISRYDNISKILEKIALTQTIHFKIEGRRITVMP